MQTVSYCPARLQPSKAAQAIAPGAHLVPGTDVYTTPLRRPILPELIPAGISKDELNRQQTFTKFWRIVGFLLLPTLSILVGSMGTGIAHLAVTAAVHVQKTLQHQGACVAICRVLKEQGV